MMWYPGIMFTVYASLVISLSDALVIKNGPGNSPAFVSTARSFLTPPSVRCQTALSMSVAPMAGQIQGALKKSSKTLAVGLEYSSDKALTGGDIETLSMQLRKAKAAALWTSDLEALALFAKEQQTAAGDFPGPCPIIYNGSEENLDAAAEAGATAVVLGADSKTKIHNLQDVEIIWKVNSKDEVTSLVESGYETAFLIDTSENASDMIESIPTSAAIIVVLEAMQDENAELEKAKELKTAGCTSILLQKAIVGDAEDLEYANFAVDGMTKKKSSQFNMTGLTGSTNGHFGGVASTVGRTWKRMMQ